MGGIDESGHKVSDNKFPYRLRFEPHPDVKNLFPTHLVNNDPNAYMKQLITVPADSTLWLMWAMDKPKELGGTERLIGNLKLDGKLVASGWGD